MNAHERHPSWCARPASGCSGIHRSRPVLVDRAGLLVRVAMLARLGESGSPWVELVVSVSPAHACSVELTAREARLIGGALRDLAHSATH